MALPRFAFVAVWCRAAQLCLTAAVSDDHDQCAAFAAKEVAVGERVMLQHGESRHTVRREPFACDKLELFEGQSTGTFVGDGVCLQADGTRGPLIGTGEGRCPHCCKTQCEETANCAAFNFTPSRRPPQPGDSPGAGGTCSLWSGPGPYTTVAKDTDPVWTATKCYAM
mmetsp:Transcript_165112/g.292376  ORF Transcript_165112/g.292376 Transcript_165112/m.292376 type:complete len:168 (-) Transcript_165112:40-543(-)